MRATSLAMIIKPKIRGFVCVTAHPTGCARHVQNQIDVVKAGGPVKDGPKNVLIVGSSTGYGLASRIAAAFGSGANTLGVFFERPSQKGKPASAGYYNTAAFTEAAEAAGLYAGNINGDAFTHEVKMAAIDKIKANMEKIDLVVYSLAAPRRTDPETGEVYKSALKPVGDAFTCKNLDTDKKIVNEITIEPAADEDILGTRKVMGGEDWELWIDALTRADVLEPGATTVAYSYLGPEVTWPIYKNGTIGLAKEHLQQSASRIDAILKIDRGRAFVSVNKAVVTQASSAIPVVPLYISLLYKLMRERGTHEDCIEQMDRLFRKQMYGGSALDFDDAGRVRMDDLEMDPALQAEIAAIWPTITTENLEAKIAFSIYQQEFLRLFGFGLNGVDYEADVDPDVPLNA